MAATLLAARWVVGHANGRHTLLRDGEVAVVGDTIAFVGRRYSGPVAERIDCGEALIAPGFIDLDALGDLDTGVLVYDNHPGWKKGRLWPARYAEHGPLETYDLDAMTVQARYALVHLIRNGITTALPIASLLYRAWAETVEQFEMMAAVAGELGYRLYLGPAYRSGYAVVHDDGRHEQRFDEARGLAGLDEAIAFARRIDGRHGGRVRAMLAPDRIEGCTPELLRRTAAASRDLAAPVRLHCCQSNFEVETIRALRGTTPIAWLDSLGFLSARAVLPHGVFAFPDDDLARVAHAGATIASCPLVMGRLARVLNARRVLAAGANLGLGTDTWPADMIENIRCGVMLGRVADPAASPIRVAEMFDAVTLGGARALGRDDLGRLAPGAKADMIVIDLPRDYLGETLDPLQHLMLSGSTRDIRSTMIDGRFVMCDRSIPGVDLGALDAAAAAVFAGLVRRLPERTPGSPPLATIIAPSYPLGG
ncbi:MAG: amidohydrolase family protein [Alphaproteobacteria bacterium]|nr:amidohydrolase family protein [Alphaproteobacteria bacterium]